MNRKQRRALERRSRNLAPANQLTKVAELLNQVDGYKEEIAALTDKVVGDSQNLKFARLLSKLEPLVDTSQLEEGDLKLFKEANELIK